MPTQATVIDSSITPHPTFARPGLQSWSIGLCPIVRRTDCCLDVQVKPFSKLSDGSHTLYVMSADGTCPSRQVVEEACQTLGGKLVDKDSLQNGNALQDSCMEEHRFSFSVMERQWRSNWGSSVASGSNDSPASSLTSL